MNNYGGLVFDDRVHQLPSIAWDGRDIIGSSTFKRLDAVYRLVKSVYEMPAKDSARSGRHFRCLIGHARYGEGSMGFVKVSRRDQHHNIYDHGNFCRRGGVSI